MADFLPAFEKMIQNEGGYKLHTVAGDRGGQTYAGIARNMHQYWQGWALIDRGQMDGELTAMVREFYRARFWDAIRGDEITDQVTAESLFDFAVNAGQGTAVKLAQLVVGATPDGALGPKTLAALNGMTGEEFRKSYALAKIARYAQICNKDRTQSKFLLGWVNRTIKALA